MTIKSFEIDGELLPVLIPYVYEREGQITADQYEAKAKALSEQAEIFTNISKIFAALAEADGDLNKTSVQIENLSKSADQGDIASAFVLGGELLTGNVSIEKDELRGLDLLVSLSKQGLAEAQAKVGRYYVYTAKQQKKALPYLYAAAMQGEPDANLLLGIAYADGVDGALEADALEALRYYRRTVEANFEIYRWQRGLASGFLGDMYRDGNGVGVDFDEAMSWYRKALEFGNADVRASLAVLLEKNGSKDEAKVLLEQAAVDGNKDAQARLADKKWDAELATLLMRGKKLNFWLKRSTFVGTDTKSNSYVTSTPGMGNAGPMVHTVTNHWKELYLQDMKGNQFKIIPPPKAEKVIFSPGEKIVVLYAGLEDNSGDANGFPYFIYRVEKDQAIAVEPAEKLLSECNLNKQVKAWVFAAIISLILMLSGTTFIGLLGLCGFGFLAAKAWNTNKESISAIQDRMSSALTWAKANLT